MQQTLKFGSHTDLAEMRDRLAAYFGSLPPIPRRAPIDQLVKSLISNRTRDAVSLSAYERLVAVYAGWRDLADAPVDEVEAIIAEVTYAEVKAPHLVAALRAVAATHPDFDLGFLAGWPVARALAWLEALPGVGRKVAASVLNFSTLGRPAFVIDTHVMRILRRFRLVGATVDTPTAYDTVMAAAQDWSAAELTDLHVLLKRLGQTLCKTVQPCCADCPLLGICPAPA